MPLENLQIFLPIACSTALRISEQTKVALNNFKDAEELFMLVQNEKLQNDYVYVSQLARCCK